MTQVPNSKMDKVFSFVRHNEHEKVFVIINFSQEAVNVTFEEPLLKRILLLERQRYVQVFVANNT